VGLLNLSPPVLGQQNSIADAATANSFNTIQTWANGNIDEANLTNGIVQKLGVNNSGNVGRGSAVIATTEARSNTAYGLMTTPDRVQGIVLPSAGYLLVLYHAYWNESVDGAARAAIFVGANQLQISQTGVAAPAVQEASCIGGASITQPLSTAPFGLTGGGAGALATGHSAPVTTGQAIAIHGSTNVEQNAAIPSGACWIFAAAGTYDVSVQFKASSGTVNVLNRRLFVMAVGF
jgi:hypothetical protein